MAILRITIYVIIGIIVFVAYGIYQERGRKGQKSPKSETPMNKGQNEGAPRGG